MNCEKGKDKEKIISGILEMDLFWELYES